jgi:hypothetical protein
MMAKATPLLIMMPMRTSLRLSHIRSLLLSLHLAELLQLVFAVIMSVALVQERGQILEVIHIIESGTVTFLFLLLSDVARSNEVCFLVFATTFGLVARVLFNFKVIANLLGRLQKFEI